jgi:hypothetical protein
MSFNIVMLIYPGCIRGKNDHCDNTTQKHYLKYETVFLKRVTKVEADHNKYTNLK